MRLVSYFECERCGEHFFTGAEARRHEGEHIANDAVENLKRDLAEIARPQTPEGSQIG